MVGAGIFCENEDSSLSGWAIHMEAHKLAQFQERMWRVLLTVACENGMCYDPNRPLSGFMRSQLKYFAKEKGV